MQPLRRFFQRNQSRRRNHARLAHAAAQQLPSNPRSEEHTSELQSPIHLVCRLLLEKKERRDRKSTRLNSSHLYISYAVFCLKYEILQLRGEGCSGAVYKARDRQLDRFVALKLIRLFLSSGPPTDPPFFPEPPLSR